MLEYVFWFVFAYAAYFYLCVYLDKRRSPPGPVPIPILGNLVQIAIADPLPSLAFAKFANKYGEVFQLHMGSKTLIVPTTVESITTLFSAPETQGRDISGTFLDRNFHRTDLGVGFSNGPRWARTKQWMIRALRDVGFGKSTGMEASASQELAHLFKEIDVTRQENDNVVPISNLFVFPAFKNVWKLVVGHLDDEDMKVLKSLLDKSEQAFRKGTVGAGLIAAYPSVRHIFPEATGHAAFMKYYMEAHKAARDLLAQARDTIDRSQENHQPQTLVEAFVFKMREEEDNPDTIFTENNWVCIYMDLMQAGSDTTSSFLESFVLFLVLYPEIQEKIFQEIKKYVPEGEKVNLTHRPKMIYTQACMLEAHRHAKVAQVLVPREVLKDFYYKKYLIKKGSIMLASLHAAYFSKDEWEDPHSFSPERFIGTNGQIINQNKVMAFGFGRRVCPGEGLSGATIYLYVTSLLQRYKLSILPGKARPRRDMQEGFTSRPFPFEVLFTERK